MGLMYSSSFGMTCSPAELQLKLTNDKHIKDADYTYHMDRSANFVTQQTPNLRLGLTKAKISSNVNAHCSFISQPCASGSGGRGKKL